MLQKDSLAYAIIGINVANMLSIRPADAFLPLVLSYPKASSKSMTITESSVNEIGVGIADVFRLEQSHDDFVYVPIEFADDLTEARVK
jgi:lipoprotein-releasing system permease protein